MGLSPKEQRDLTITYAAMLGGDMVQHGNYWTCGGYAGGEPYLAAVRYLEAQGHYLHSNGILMKLKFTS